MNTQEKPDLRNDLDYMRGGRSFQTDCSILRSTSEYLNSAVIRELHSNEGLRKSGPDVVSTTLIPEFYQTFDALKDQDEIAQLFREDAGRLPDLRAWLDERYMAHIEYDQVKNAPPGTLGYGIRLMLGQGFQLYFSHLGPAETDFAYMRKRRAQVHDLEHIVTGFPATMPGEIALYAAHLASSYNYFQPRLAKETTIVSAFLMTTWTLRTSLHYPEAMLALCDAQEKGTKLGRSLKRPLYMERLEDYLDWKLPDLRAHFSIPEPNDLIGDWSWQEP